MNARTVFFQNNYIAPPPSGGSVEALTVRQSQGFTESPTGTFTSTFPNYASAIWFNKKIAAGTDGWMEVDIAAATETSIFIGLDVTAALQLVINGSTQEFDYAAFIDPDTFQYAVVQGQGLPVEYGAAAPGKLRIARASGVISAQYSPDGVTYTTYHTFSGTNNSDLYLLAGAGTSGKRVINPKGFNLVNA